MSRRAVLCCPGDWTTTRTQRILRTIVRGPARSAASHPGASLRRKREGTFVSHICEVVGRSSAGSRPAVRQHTIVAPNLKAAQLWAGSGPAVSHRAAAALWHLDGNPPDWSRSPSHIRCPHRHRGSSFTRRSDSATATSPIIAGSLLRRSPGRSSTLEPSSVRGGSKAPLITPAGSSWCPTTISSRN
jgi:hypothetical protein